MDIHDCEDNVIGKFWDDESRGSPNSGYPEFVGVHLWTDKIVYGDTQDEVIRHLREVHYEEMAAMRTEYYRLGAILHRYNLI